MKHSEESETVSKKKSEKQDKEQTVKHSEESETVSKKKQDNEQSKKKSKKQSKKPAGSSEGVCICMCKCMLEVPGLNWYLLPDTMENPETHPEKGV